MDHIGERFAGVDWATDAHAVCVVDAAGAVLAEFDVEHTAVGLAELCRRLDAASVRRVAIERPDGPVVEELLAGGFEVVVVSSRAVKALRVRYGAAGNKCDRGDAYVLADCLRTDGHRWAALEPDSPATVSLRAHVRTRKDLVTARVAAANQLRAHLRVTFPAAVGLFSRIDSAISLRFLQRFPSVARARWLSPKRLSAWLGANRYSGRSSAEQLHERLTAAAPGIDGDDHSSVTLAYVAVLKTIGAQIKELDSRIAELLDAHPDGPIFKSLCAASEFDAEMVPRIEPTLAGSRVDLRGVVSERERSSSAAACAVAGGEVGDFFGGDLAGGYPGRGGPPPRCRCVHGHRHPPHGEGRRSGGFGGPPGPAGQGAQLGAGAGPKGGRPVDRGRQVPGDRAGAAAGKSRLGLNGAVPARVPAQAKELILELVDDAVRGGVSHRWACSVLGVSDDRAHRWRRRLRDAGSLEDRRPGGVALHALRPSETAEILAVCEQWGPVDRSYRKLAHRGSYEGRVWVSASTLRRVLAAQGLILPKPPARDPAPWVRWPHWLVWEPNKIWCWDMTHFPRAERAAFAIVDVVSRRWIDTLVSIEETSTQVRVLFDRALATEGLTELITPERVELFEQDPTQPILLACSDNGPQMTSQATRELFAALAVAQRLGRPGTPTDQAWIESLFGHVKAENPHLEQIRDPAVLQTELRRARRDS